MDERHFMFGARIDAAVRMIGEVLREEVVGKWLATPLPVFDELTPVEVIWNEGEDGLKKIQQVIDAVKDFQPI